MRLLLQEVNGPFQVAFRDEGLSGLISSLIYQLQPLQVLPVQVVFHLVSPGLLLPFRVLHIGIWYFEGLLLGQLVAYSFELCLWKIGESLLRLKYAIPLTLSYKFITKPCSSPVNSLIHLHRRSSPILCSSDDPGSGAQSGHCSELG